MKNTINMKEIHFAYLSERDTATPSLLIHGLREGSGKLVEINIPFEGACYLAAAIQGQICFRKKRADSMFEKLAETIKLHMPGMVEK
jgi:hypothetical protein